MGTCSTTFSFPDCIFDRYVFVGDVVVVRDPEKSENRLVRRVAAIEGHEMVSKDEKDEPFVLEEDQCWVLADNDNLKPKVSLNFMFKDLMISNVGKDLNESN